MKDISNILWKPAFVNLVWNAGGLTTYTIYHYISQDKLRNEAIAIMKEFFKLTD